MRSKLRIIWKTRIELDQPINLHLTGCPHSCAQHYIGDIGLLGTKVERGDDLVEGYHMFIGGGYGDQQEIGRELYRDIPATEYLLAPSTCWQHIFAIASVRAESFREWTKRYSTEQLQALCEEQYSSRACSQLKSCSSCRFYSEEQGWAFRYFLTMRRLHQPNVHG